MKRLLLLAASLLYANQSMAYEASTTGAAVAIRLEVGDNRALATEAFTAMFNLAADTLRNSGRGEEADQLLSDWGGTYAPVMLGMLGDVGDHKPVSEWINLTYAALASELGNQVMEATHLKDIWVLNNTLHVVFNPHQAEDWCAEQLHKYPADTCEAEYRRHFAGTKFYPNDPYATDQYNHFGFAPVVVYWLVYAGCEVGTQGTGVVLVCSLGATVAEVAFAKFVAPKMSVRIWERKNP